MPGNQPCLQPPAPVTWGLRLVAHSGPRLDPAEPPRTRGSAGGGCELRCDPLSCIRVSSPGIRISGDSAAAEWTWTVCDLCSSSRGYFSKDQNASLSEPPPSAPDTLGALICLSFCNTDLPVGCMLVLMLMTTVLRRTGAVPVPTPLSALPGVRDCPMAQFKSLPPQDMKAFRRAKDALEESLLLKNWSCSSHPLPRTRDLRQLQVWERPVALEAELALTLKVLGTMANSTLGDILEQPLHMLRYIHTKLQACVPAQATAGPRPRGYLHRWLRRLQVASKESPACLEASVTFNLFRLLTHDLNCVASGDLCV
ncbi:LOW QUALITY PROTEIN: interferon lambda-3-like [Artibeus jamaicensis]|uniref:LOW QUALITY PROTEIN: interferon lambda-3-like n=1 Tax=Artibeus jamaicensis TaxID=9417 RepID=UPI00235A979E|nr:LOW QUALITY PROTEIN: interferon lambda-3-like [Artibeus jamaicensis]